MPGRVPLTAAVGAHFPGDRGGGATQGAGDAAERLIAADSKENLFTLLDRQAPLPWFPTERISIKMLAGTHHETDHRRGAADLHGDVDESPALGSQPECQFLLLGTQVPVMSLHCRPPVIGCRSFDARVVALTGGIRHLIGPSQLFDLAVELHGLRPAHRW